jgi:hypothetical protein
LISSAQILDRILEGVDLVEQPFQALNVGLEFVGGLAVGVPSWSLSSGGVEADRDTPQQR